MTHTPWRSGSWRTGGPGRGGGLDRGERQTFLRSWRLCRILPAFLDLTRSRMATKPPSFSPPPHARALPRGAVEKVRAAMKAARLPALLVTSFVDVSWLTGFEGDDSYVILTPRRCNPHCSDSALRRTNLPRSPLAQQHRHTQSPSWTKSPSSSKSSTPPPSPSRPNPSP